MRQLATLFLVLGVLAAPASAQEEPPEPERPEPEQIDVERPLEIARIQAELKRIETERKRLSGRDRPDVGAQVESLRDQELSPILAPRTEVVGLTLKEAIARALANNPDYLITLLEARATQEGIIQERANFDPRLSFSPTWGKSRRTVSVGGGTTGLVASESLTFNTTLSTRFITGTELALTWSESRSVTNSPFAFGTGSKSYSPALTLSLTQPLLKNFGIDVNTTGIRIAQNSALSSDADLANAYMGAVLSVEQAYWNLVLTEEQLRAQERSLRSSIKFLDDQRKKLEHGAGTRLEVTIAKAGVARTREAVIVAENALESARDSLIRLTAPSSDPTKWDQFLVPLDLPQLVEEPDLDPAEVIQTALARRPDYLRSSLSLKSAILNREFSDNQVLPSLNFVGSFSEGGFGVTHHDAWQELSSGDNYSWSVGFSLELPLFLRSERSAARAAMLRVEQAEAALLALEANVILEVRSAIRDVRTSKARTEASRASRILAQERLEATRVQVETGTAVPRDVLDDLADLAAAETSEVQAFINYRLSLSRLQVAQGTALEEWVDVLAPRVRMALDRIPYSDR